MTPTIERPAPIIGPFPNTPEWHEWRNTGIGASEAAAACGLSPYETPLHIYARKLGEMPPIEDNDAMRLGRLLEPVVIQEFVRRTDRQVRQAHCPVMRHGTISCVLATPDAILVDGDLLECKTTTWRTAKDLGEEGSDYVPEHWLCQAQQQLSVMGADRCHLAALIDGRTLKTFQIERNDHLIRLIIAAEVELWERIQDRRPPEPNWEHARTAELIREMHGIAEGKTIVLDDEFAALWQQQKQLAEQIKALEAQREVMRAKVLHAIGDASIALLPDQATELRRSVVKAATVSYQRKEYVSITERKTKARHA